MRHFRATAVLLTGAIAASLMLGGCGGIDADAVGATIGDQEISLGYMNFVARYTQSSYDSFMSYYYGTDVNYWTSEDYADDDGALMQESVKDTVVSNIETQYLLEAHMDDYGVEIDDDTMAEIKEAAQQFMSDNDKKTIKAIGATEEYVEDFLYYQTVQSLMEAAIEDEVGNDLDIADYSRRTFSYVEIDAVGYTDDDDNYLEYTDEEVEQVYENVAYLAELAQDDYDGTMEDYGLEVSTYSYGEDDDGFDETVLKEADKMSEGDISGCIVGDGYCYVIRLDSEDDEDAAESAMEDAASTMKSDHYTEVTDAYEEDSDFTVDEDAWAKVTFDNLFEEDDGDDEE